MHIDISFPLILFLIGFIPFNNDPLASCHSCFSRFFYSFCVYIFVMLLFVYVTVLYSVFVFCQVVVCVFVGDSPIGFIKPPVFALSFETKPIKTKN